MELQQALETILEETTSLIKVDRSHTKKQVELIRDSLVCEITRGFFLPLTYVEAARSYIRAELPEGKAVAAKLYNNAFSHFNLMDERKDHRDLQYLVKQLSFNGFMRYNDPESYQSSILAGTNNKKLKTIYSKLSDVHKTIVDHYFNNLMNEVQEYQRSKKIK